MSLTKQSCLTLAAVFLLLTACTREIMVRSSDQQKSPERLVVYADGKKVFKNRVLPDDDVIIYQDGRGGEKAAVKVYAPLHPSFFRDSIVVERRLPGDAVVSDADWRQFPDPSSYQNTVTLSPNRTAFFTGYLAWIDFMDYASLYMQ